MVAINEILLPGCTGEGCGGETGTCTDSRVHRRNAENRAPATRNHLRAVAFGRWLTRDPIGYQGGINLYGYVNSSPVGSVDAWAHSSLSFPSNFVKGMGTFSIIASNSNISSYRTHVRVKFTPSAAAKCRCKEIEFIQFANTTYYHTFLSNSTKWHLDNGKGSYGKAKYYHGHWPFFAGQTPWTDIPPQTGIFPAEVSDTPGGGEGIANVAIRQEFKVYAVCTHGPDAGKSFGYLSWGETMSWGFDAFGNPTNPTKITRWVEGHSVSGPGSKDVILSRSGILPLPGGVSW